MFYLIAPASKSKPGVVQKAVSKLKKRGYKVSVQKPLFTNEVVFHASSDSNRWRGFVKALSKPNVIWCVRGGYGSNRLLPWLSKLKKPKHKSLLVGYSDITYLSVFLNQFWKWPTIHGPLVERYANGLLNAQQEKEFFDVLEGRQKEVLFKKLKPLNASAKKLKNKKLTASVVGGNLKCVESLLGTPWQLKTAGNFLFLEDIGERGYQLDRMFEHMVQAGGLKGCKAILLGDFITGDEPNGKNYVRDAILRFASLTSIPVFDGMSTGHGKGQRMLPLGTKAVLHVKSTAELTVKAVSL